MWEPDLVVSWRAHAGWRGAVTAEQHTLDCGREAATPTGAHSTWPVCGGGDKTQRPHRTLMTLLALSSKHWVWSTAVSHLPSHSR